MPNKKYDWPAIAGIRRIPGLSNAQEANIERAAANTGRTDEIARMLVRWTTATGTMRATIRTLIDEAAGAYIVENSDVPTKPEQPAKADAITIIISGRDRENGALEHIVLDTDGVAAVTDDQMYERGPHYIIVTTDASSDQKEFAALLAKTLDRDTEQGATAMMPDAFAAITADATPSSTEKTTVTTGTGGQSKETKAIAEIRCGETTITADINAPAMMLTANDAARRALEHARERFSVKLQNRLGSR